MRAYVAFLVVLSALSVAAMSALSAQKHPSGLTIAGLLAVLTAAEYLVVRFQYRGEIMALSLFEAVLAPTLFVLSPLLVIGVVAVAQIVAAVGHRLPPLKMIFNSAQWVIGASAGAMVFHALGGGGALSTRSLSALAAAMTAVVVVNALAFTFVIHITEERRIIEVASDLIPTILLGWIVNVGFGVLFVTAIARSPIAVALYLVPLIALHAASRGVAAALADQRRLGAMNGTLMSLAIPTTPHEAIPRFLVGVRDCFGAASVEMLLHRDDADIVHAIENGTGDYRRLDPPTPGSLPTVLGDLHGAVRITRGSHAHETRADSAALARAGHRQCLAAPLLVDGRVAGVLCVYDSTGFEGFEQGELAVMQALAGEAAGMIQRATLNGEIVEERRKFAEVIDSTSDGIATIAADGTIELWNPGMEAITGYSADAMTGTAGFGILLPLDQGHSPVTFDNWSATGTLPPEAIEVTSSDGEVRSLTCSYTPVRDDNGRATVLIVVARDVTRIRELESLKDDFIATVSHELRTPLTPIKGWAQMLLQRNEGDAIARQGLEAIARQADRLEHLLTDLLEVSRVERGAHDLREGAVDAVDLARAIVDEARIANADRLIHLDIPTDACIARADAMWVERIVGNLVSNAMKYAPGSQPVLVRVAKTGDCILIEVMDRGPGIPERDQERIFERFARLGDHNTRTAGGAGLGLYIARTLAASMGGTLTVHSAPGHTTFSLRLPAAAALASVG